MTHWTPALETAIRAVGDFMEAQAKDGYDPAISPDDSAASIVDRFNRVGEKAYITAFREAGLPAAIGAATFGRNTDELIRLAKENGSDAAYKIIRADALETELRNRVPEMRGLSGDSPESVRKILVLSKKAGLTW